MIVYLFLIRGIPLLVLLTFAYYLLPLTGIDLPPFWGVVLVIAFYYAAFMSEVFRAGILSLPQAQWDAARSLGMTRPLMLQIVQVPISPILHGFPGSVMAIVSLLTSVAKLSLVTESAGRGKRCPRQGRSPLQDSSAIHRAREARYAPRRRPSTYPQRYTSTGIFECVSTLTGLVRITGWPGREVRVG